MATLKKTGKKTAKKKKKTVKTAAAKTMLKKAGKNTAARTAKKKKRPTAKTTARTVTINYKCVTGFCTATPKHPKIHAGDTVKMCAQNTNVSIKFTNGSPFVSGAGGTSPIAISAGNCRSEVVANPPAGKEFNYPFPCLACPGPADEPSMIFD